MTDGAGQVTFPDVPPGRYIIIGLAPGFVTRDSRRLHRQGRTKRRRCCSIRS